MVQAFSQRPEPQSFQPLRPCAAPSDPLRRLRDGGGLDCVRRPDGKRCVALELGRQRQRSAGWGEVAKGPMRGMPTQCRCMERETSSSCRPLPGRMGPGPFAGLGSARILEIDAFPGRSRPQNGQTGKGASFRAGSTTRHASPLTPATGRQQLGVNNGRASPVASDLPALGQFGWPQGVVLLERLMNPGAGRQHVNVVVGQNG